MNNNNSSLSASEYALLGFLLDGPCHGYDLHKKLAESNGLGIVWDIKIANMYAQLEKLEKRGLISGEIQENEQRPVRTEYSLTSAGKTEFVRWLHEPALHPREFRHGFLIRVFFLSSRPPEELNTLIERQLETCRQWQRDLEESGETRMLAENFANLTSYFRYSQIQSMMDWLKWLKNQVTTNSIQRGEQ